jgi:hypothetical protein
MILGGLGGNRYIKMAEGAGFEPAVLQRRTTVFKTVTIGHSDTPPAFRFYPISDRSYKVISGGGGAKVKGIREA